MSPVVVRFAPSPTGLIHIGNARTAVLNALFARRANGRFILRFDDTDAERSRTEFATAISDDLEWLGIPPDRTIRQSDNLHAYSAAADTLKKAGRLYPCYETPDELERRRRRQIARGLPPLYDRSALQLSLDERSALEASGRRPHWRFQLDPRTIAWRDLVRGDSHIDCRSLSDPVLVREDGSYLYTLPSVVDDANEGVTHIIRGEDHVTNTAVQIQLFDALGVGDHPSFGHHNLLTSVTGEGLSKRSGALSIAGLREAGIEALAVAALAVLTGSARAVTVVTDLAELADTLDLGDLSRGLAKFDPAELAALSARTLHHLPFAAVRERLASRGIAGARAEPFWMAVRGNLQSFADVDGFWTIVDGVVAPSLEADDLRAAAVALLPPEPWDATTWATWTSALKTQTGLKGRALFHPLRLALTGREDGPELAALLPLIGRVRAAARLGGHSA